MQCKFVMFQTQAVSPITFRFHRSVQAKIIRILLVLLCLEKPGKTGKNALSVAGGQRAVTLCAGVIPLSKFCKYVNTLSMSNNNI